MRHQIFILDFGCTKKGFESCYANIHFAFDTYNFVSKYNCGFSTAMSLNNSSPK